MSIVGTFANRIVSVNRNCRYQRNYNNRQHYQADRPLPARVGRLLLAAVLSLSAVPAFFILLLVAVLSLTLVPAPVIALFAILPFLRLLGLRLLVICHYFRSSSTKTRNRLAPSILCGTATRRAWISFNSMIEISVLFLMRIPHPPILCIYSVCRSPHPYIVD